MRPARKRSSSSAWRERASCSTELRIEASGFRISCASDALSAATDSSRSARAWSSCTSFRSEMSVKMAVTDGASWVS